MSRAFAENIKQILRQRGMTQNDLAQELGMSPTGVSAALNNPHAKEPLWKVRKYAEVLGVQPQDLITPIGAIPPSGEDEAFRLRDARDYLEESVRPSYAEQWFNIARIVARRSTCPRLSVGAVIVSPENRLLTTGTNGSPSGLDHCTDVGCLIDAHGHCRRALHAEWNAILQAAQTSVDITGATMYVTAQPCPTCTVAILNSGITQVLYRYVYPHPEELEVGIAKMITQSNIGFMRWRGDDQ